MWRFSILFCSIWPQIITETEILYSNGWIPIAGDRIFHHINHKYTQLPPIMATHKIQIVYTDINKAPVVEKETDVPEKNNVVDATNTADDTILVCKDCIKEDTQFQYEANDFSPNAFQAQIQNDTSSKARKSKQIEGYQFGSDNVNVVVNYDKNNSNSSLNEAIKRYEVTEPAVDDNDDQDKREISTGYVYDPPKNAFTKEFQDILGKYKIKDTDELENYALSRRPKVHNCPKNILPSYRYNNLNHVSADPLLAVLLSNYGFYLQGLYGIHNNYKNLYGYLASNNIHNNRPFGFYKIFSDTDSSH